MQSAELFLQKVPITDRYAANMIRNIQGLLIEGQEINKMEPVQKLKKHADQLCQVEETKSQGEAINFWLGIVKMLSAVA